MSVIGAGHPIHPLMPIIGSFPLLTASLVALAMLVAMSDRATGATANTTVGADVLVASTLGAGGCLPGVAGTTSFGTIAAGTSVVASSDCTVTWGTNAATAMLRIYQSDLAGVAMTSAGPSVPDYDQGTNDWLLGNGHFGACLHAKGATTTAAWTLDGSCAAVDGGHWNDVPNSTVSLGARVASSDSTGSVGLRFGLRTPTLQAAQAYSAGITFEVVAPDPGPGGAPTAGAVNIAGTAALGQTLTANPSGWNMGSPAGSYAYQWVRCGTGGGTCVDIAGQTGASYVVSGADGGRTLRLRIDVSNVYGSASATSTQSAVIIDAVGDEGGTNATTISNATTLTVTRPPNAFEGDVLVAQVVVRDGTDVAFTTVPAGWVLIRRTDESNRVAMATYRKILTAAEPAGYTWIWNVSDRATIGVEAFSAVDPTTPVSISSGNTGSSALATATGIAVPDNNSTLVAMYGSRDTLTYTDNNAMNALWQLAGGGGNVGAFGRWKLINSGASGNRTATLSSGSDWVAQLIALKPRP
ncbi:MAG: exported protein of unknown function [Thermoleophilia bacterium]|nr:exported protein of unknown function [Thermoleophilia bacterium]